MDKWEFDTRFSYHASKGDRPARYEALRAKAREFAELIEQSCPESREKAMAFTGRR